jgi:hypothetical protein
MSTRGSNRQVRSRSRRDFVRASVGLAGGLAHLSWGFLDAVHKGVPAMYANSSRMAALPPTTRTMK